MHNKRTAKTDCKKTNNLTNISSYELATDNCSIALLESLKNQTQDKVIDRKKKLDYYTRSGLGLTDMYRNAKKHCFPDIPHDQRNRAGQKLKELFDAEQHFPTHVLASFQF